MSVKRKLAEIVVEFDELGKPKIFWVCSFGYWAAQGGTEFEFGSSGADSLGKALEYLKLKLDDETLEQFCKVVKADQHEGVKMAKRRKLSEIYNEMDEINKRKPTDKELGELAEVLNETEDNSENKDKKCEDGE